MKSVKMHLCAHIVNVHKVGFSILHYNYCGNRAALLHWIMFCSNIIENELRELLGVSERKLDGEPYPLPPVRYAGL